ncbi:MAG: hypothetical protein Q8P54_01415 [bacterium]|nr:hypothetical protein [bacterium]
MKPRDIVIIIICIIIILISGIILYSNFAPVPKDSGITVEIPRKVDPNFNQEQTQELKGLTDYTIDLGQVTPDPNKKPF